MDTPPSTKSATPVMKLKASEAKRRLRDLLRPPKTLERVETIDRGDQDATACHSTKVAMITPPHAEPDVPAADGLPGRLGLGLQQVVEPEEAW